MGGKDMEINIYSKYRVESVSKGSHYNFTEASRDFLNGWVVDIVEDHHESCIEMEGGELLQRISEFLADEDFDQIEIGEDTIFFSWFKPTTGLSDEITWKIVKIDETTVV